ncbi:hypothetical protein GCM10007061_10480 [Kocuria marina]|nr:hypothetical protein GCM10007061_10480 [Kocuria marina]
MTAAAGGAVTSAVHPAVGETAGSPGATTIVGARIAVAPIAPRTAGARGAVPEIGTVSAAEAAADAVHPATTLAAATGAGTSGRGFTAGAVMSAGMMTGEAATAVTTIDAVRATALVVRNGAATGVGTSVVTGTVVRAAMDVGTTVVMVVLGDVMIAGTGIAGTGASRAGAVTGLARAAGAASERATSAATTVTTGAVTHVAPSAMTAEMPSRGSWPRTSTRTSRVGKSTGPCAGNCRPSRRAMPSGCPNTS